MLGVEAPVSLLVVREIVVQALLAVAARDRRLPAGPPRAGRGADRLQAVAPAARDRAPAPPPAAARPQRRALRAARRRGAALRPSGRPAGAESSAGSSDGLRLARPADARPVRAAGGDPRRHRRWSRSRSSSCASGTWRCSPATSTWPRPRTTRCASSRSRRRAARSSTATARSLVDNRTALELQVKETELPPARERRARLFARVGEIAGLRPEQIRNKIRAEAKELRRLPGDPAPRRPLRHSSTTCARTSGASRGLGRARLRAPLSRRGRSPRTCSATRARSTPSSSRTRATRRSSPATRSARRGSSTPTTASCAASTAPAGSRSTPPASRPAAGSPSASRRTGNDLVLTIDDEVQSAGESAIGSDRAAGRLRGDERPRRPALRARLEPELRPVDLRQARGCPPPDLRARSPSEDLGAAAVQPRHPGLLSRPARRSSRSPRWRRSTPARSTSARSSTTPAASRSATARCCTNAGDAVNGADRPAPGAQGLLRRLLLHARRPHERATAATAARSSSGRARSGSASRPASTSAARARAGCRRPSSATSNFRDNTDPDSPCGEEVCIEKGEVTDREWSVGDNVNLAIGQGDLQADPLQMAVAYAAIANGGDDRPPARRAPRSRTRRGARSRRSTRRSATTSRSTRPRSGRSWTASTARRWSPAAPRTTSSAATRSRSPARPAPPRRPLGRRPVLVHRPGAVRRPQVRGRGDDRARAGSAPTRRPRRPGRSSTSCSTSTTGKIDEVERRGARCSSDGGLSAAPARRSSAARDA